MLKSTDVTDRLLRRWPLPSAGGSKYERGQVVVIGGAMRSPGAAVLAGTAALRVGAGRLTLAVGRSIAGQVGVAVPESGIVPLSETADGHVAGDAILAARSDLSSADAVLVGPGLDSVDETLGMLRRLPELIADDTIVLLDAFALGALAQDRDLARAFSNRLILTPNTQEAAILLERDTDDDRKDAMDLAERFQAVVSYSSVIAAPGEEPWVITAGNPGLGTSGSGDVLAGAITGLSARGASRAQAGVWGSWAHAEAGDRLSQRIGPLGFLASEIAAELPSVITLT